MRDGGSWIGQTFKLFDDSSNLRHGTTLISLNVMARKPA